MADLEATKRDLVDAISMLVGLGVIDFNGHASIRLDDGRILINSGASTRSALKPEDLSIIDLDGELCEGATPPMEYHIHTEIYRRRRQAGAVIHAHPMWSTLLSSAASTVEPVFAQGCLVADLPVFDDPLSINSADRGAALADRLGDARGILMKAHGAVLVGADIVEAFVLAVYLEQNCERQVRGAAIGKPYVFAPAERAACVTNLDKRHLFRKCWNFYRAQLG